MSRRSVVIIDYGMGNLLSVRRGLEANNAEVTISGDAKIIQAADRLVLPGVGAFAAGMEGLSQNGVAEAVKEVALKGRPLLGICLGMQMLMDWSDEHQKTDGLGLIKGSVNRIPDTDADGTVRKIPHIGWNRIRPGHGVDWSGTCLDAIQANTFYYFVHSFSAAPELPGEQLAVADYEGTPVTAAVCRENVTGLQFHPEKSGPDGLAILGRFLTL